MKAFGLEIRRAGGMANLYKDVDAVLAAADPATTQRHAVAHALQKMLEPGDHFSVCTVDTCASLCGVCVPRERRLIYQAAHCMSWRDMLPEYRSLLAAMVLDDFRAVPAPQAADT